MTTTDTYVINVPADIADRDERNRVALLAAEEASSVYAIPSEWEIAGDDGETVIVLRRRNADPKFPPEKCYG